MSAIANKSIARVQGENVTQLPEDLYIPPDALEVFLDLFEGPLDLLLYLIRKQNLEILDIPIAKITEQYMEYISLMQAMRLELAAEYLLMAAMLAEIKSRMLLPKPPAVEDEEVADPRAELVRRLQEYERFKTAAHELDELPRQERDIFDVSVELPDLSINRPLPGVSFDELMLALRDVMVRTEQTAHHHIQREALSIRQRMSEVLERIDALDYTPFNQLFTVEEGKMGVVVTFIAILELVKQSMITFIQSEPYSPIYVKGVTHE